MEHVDVAVIGAGQAGLAVSHELTVAGREHVVLERRRVGEGWSRLWDSFCLVTPNWTVRLPGFPYDGDDPDGFMPRDEIVGYLQRYAASFNAPVRENVAVESVGRTAAGAFVLNTSAGPMSAGTLVMATGAFQRPHRISGATTLPPDLPQVDAVDYRNPAALPAGKILIIGSGQSGAQIAEELRATGREVYLSCGRAAWVPRRMAGHDIAWWLMEAGFFGQSLASLPSPAARLLSNPLTSGHDGGHDLHLRTLRAMGVTLTGRFLGASGSEAHFAPDLGETVAWGDARHRELMDACRRVAVERGLERPEIPEAEAFDPRAPERLDLSGFGAVIFAGGFRPDYSSCLPWPEALDELGFPLQRDGASTVIPGLFYLGTPFLRTRGSSLLSGVGEDARVVAGQIAERRPHQAD